MKVSIKSALVGGFIGLQVIPVSIILVSSYWTSQEVLLRHAKDIMENIATFTVHEAQSYLNPAQDAARLTQRLADSDVVSRQNKAVLEQYFYEQLALHSNFAGIYLGSPTGEFVYVSRMDAKVQGGYRTKTIAVRNGVRTVELVWKDRNQQEIGREFDPADTYDPTQRPWYIKARETGQTVWTAPYIFFTSRQPGLTAASPALDSEGNLTGVVGVDIEIDQISTFLSHLKVGKKGLAFILDRGGDVVAFPDPSKIKRPTERGDGTFRLTKITELEDVLSRKAFEALHRPGEGLDIDEPVFGFFRHEGKNYHTMFTPFSNAQWPWVIGIYLPEDDYLGPIKRNRLHSIYVIVGLAALASLVGLLIARSIVRPMTAFQAEALAVKDEDLDTTFDKRSGIREIQQTADSFTQMKEGLKVTRRRNAELAQGLKEHAEELEQKEMHLRATFTSLVNFSDALIILDRNHSVRFINPAAEALLRVQRAKVLARPFMYPCSKDRTAEIEISAPGVLSSIAEMRVVDTEWEGQPALLVALRDITERKAMEGEIRWRADTLAALHDIAVELATQEALPELLRTIAARASDLLRAKGVGVFLYRPEADALESVLWHNLEPSIAGTLIRKGEGVSGRVLETGQPMIVNDYANWEGRLPQHKSSSFNVCVAVPIVWADRTLGVLLVGDDPPRQFSEEDIELLERFSPLAAAALEQRRLLAEAEVLYERAQQDSETKSVLLKEVNHRVKNNLSAVIGLLYAERRLAGETQEQRYLAKIQDLINRMQGLATVHSLLSASEWRPVLLSELAARIIDSLLQTLPQVENVKVDVRPSAIRVPPSQANSLAMVLNEMATNAVKHALIRQESGRIEVDITAAGDDGSVRLQFRDDGAGFPEEVLRRERYGTGLYIIQSIVERDLGGELRLRNDRGAEAVIRFHLAQDSGEAKHAKFAQVTDRRG